jgi:hypothetical protein
MDDNLKPNLQRRLRYVHEGFKKAKMQMQSSLPYDYSIDEVCKNEKDILMTSDQLVIIFGEPGLGKTFLFEKLEKSLKEDSFTAKLVLLRNGFSEVRKITESSENNEHYFLFDGFDELSEHDVIDFIKIIKDLNEKSRNAKVYISSRKSFIEKHEDLFSGLNPKYYELERFTESEILNFMRDFNLSSETIEKVYGYICELTGSQTLSVPRYLNYFCQFLRERADNVFPKLHEIFNDVVKRALKKESSEAQLRMHTHMVERVLAKLALVMQIHQVVSISPEDLITFFDTVSSELKSYCISSDSFLVFSEKLLQFNGHQYTFYNREIQEYLASTELSCFPEPRRAIFTLCFDSQSKMIKPFWLNCLKFFFDKHNDLFLDMTLYLLSLTERNGKVIYTVEDSYWKIAPQDVKKEGIHFKEGQVKYFFERTFNYFNSIHCYLDSGIIPSLVCIYDTTYEDIVNKWISESNEGSDNVKLINIARLIGGLSGKHGPTIPKDEWKNWLLELVQNKIHDEKFSSAVSEALYALQHFKDESIIKIAAEIVQSNNNKGIGEALINLCLKINKEHESSIKLFLILLEKNYFSAFTALTQCRNEENIVKIINAVTNDRRLLINLLKQISSSSQNSSTSLFHQLFTGKVDKKSLLECLPAFIEKMIRSLGENCVVQSGDSLYQLCQSFSDHNEYILLDVISRIKDEVISHEEVTIAQGLSYFVSQKNFEIIKKSNYQNLSENFFKLLQYYIECRSNVNKLNPVDTEPQSISHDSEIFQSIKDNQFEISKDSLNKLKNSLKSLINDGIMLSADHKESCLQFIEKNIFNAINPDKAKIKSADNGGFWISDDLSIFGLGIQIYDLLDKNKDIDRVRYLSYLPFAFPEENEILCRKIDSLSQEESIELVKKYSNEEALRKYKIKNLITASKLLKREDIFKFFPEFIKDSVIDPDNKVELITALVSCNYFDEKLIELRDDQSICNNSKIVECINDYLINRYHSLEAAKSRAEEIISRSAIIPDNSDIVFSHPSEIEIEILDKKFAHPLLIASDPKLKSIYIYILEESFKLLSKNEGYSRYVKYLWDIVIQYTKNLVIYRSYRPLADLEQTVEKHLNVQQSHWILYKFAEVRSYYSQMLAAPSSFINSVMQYNNLIEAIVTPVNSDFELSQYIKEVLEKDLSFWINETGRKVIQNILDESNKQHEVALARHLEIIILDSLNKNRHCNYNFTVIREPQLSNDQRVDLLISYGFIGPCLIELKLCSNSDMKAKDLSTTKSYGNVQNYMKGYSCTHGFFVVLIDEELNSQQREKIKNCYSKIEGLSIYIFKLSRCQKEVLRKSNSVNPF